MFPRSQAFLFAGVLLISLLLTRGGGTSPKEIAVSRNSLPSGGGFFSLQQASIREIAVDVPRVPARKWDVPDPAISARAALVYSLDDRIPLFYKNTKEAFTLASLTKLVTAIAVAEDIGLDKNIPITQEIIATEGEAGNLVSGEVYAARDLLAIMLLASSNDAAAAFEAYYGGTGKFAELLNRKVSEQELASTVLYDGSGLNDSNKSTAYDMFSLILYILEHHPDFFQLTQNLQLNIQPVNDPQTKTVYNINSLAGDPIFLGGKTGTSPEAGENLVALLRHGDRRIVTILFGSKNRAKDAHAVLDWIEEAYEFQN